MNTNTVIYPFPFPDLKYQLLQLHGSNYFSQIDLANGYYQIEMNTEDIEKTSFVILGDQFEYLRMPFGLSQAPRTFQSAMRRIFGDLKYVKIFLDDILVHSNSISERINGLITTTLRIYRNEKSFKEAVRLSEFYINSTYNRNIYSTPNELHHEKNLLGIKECKTRDQEEVYKKMKAQKYKELQKTNVKRNKNIHYQIGDKVYVKNNSPFKLDPIWKGPYEVIEKKANETFFYFKQMTKDNGSVSNN